MVLNRYTLVRLVQRLATTVVFYTENLPVTYVQIYFSISLSTDDKCFSRSFARQSLYQWKYY